MRADLALPPDWTRESDEVFYAANDRIRVGAAELDLLKRLALAAPRRRSRLCTHRSTSDRLHEMLIVNTQDVYVRAHRHHDKAESFMVLEGLVDVVFFDEGGTAADVVRMGPLASGRASYCRMNSAQYHTLVFRTPFVVLHETTGGPWVREQTEAAPWAPCDRVSDVREYQRSLVDLIDRWPAR
ncbi:MAG: WbuC family cupin fold metalloprotein [Acidobacteriota bacterium]